MGAKILLKNELSRFLEALLEEGSVAAPVRRGDTVSFEPVTSALDVIPDGAGPAFSCKPFLLPRREPLFSSPPEGDRVEEHTGIRDPMVLFGLRPCDAEAIAFLDRVFLEGENPDPYYRSRRSTMKIVSLGCAEPRDTCFCSATGAGPQSPRGSDALLTDIGDRYLVQCITRAGHEIPAILRLPDAAGADVRKAEEAARGIEGKMLPLFELKAMKESLAASFDDEAWRTLTEKCIGCGVCTFLCPTCHCFDIVDEELPDLRVRSRIWDTCQFPGFTAQASGFNPRPTHRERYRQRIMHKFSYCMENYGAPGCSGCGRCVEACPVNLDIRRILAFFMDRKGMK